MIQGDGGSSRVGARDEQLREFASLVVAYVMRYGMEISAEGNALWDACEAILGADISGTPADRATRMFVDPLHGLTDAQ